MDLNLDSFLVEMQQWLGDPDASIWPQEVLHNCLRQALAAVQRVCPLKLSIAGLDDALITVLADDMPQLLVRLARVQAWQVRLMQRSELFQPDATRAIPAAALLDLENKQLQQDLENLRLSYLQRSSTLPYVIWPEDPALEDETEE